MDLCPTHEASPLRQSSPYQVLAKPMELDSEEVSKEGAQTQLTKLKKLKSKLNLTPSILCKIFKYYNEFIFQWFSILH